jgi:hypothetical protein
VVLGLVIPCCVDCEVSEDFPCGGVDDVDVEVLDEDEDVGSGVGSSDADVVEFAVDP